MLDSKESPTKRRAKHQNMDKERTKIFTYLFKAAVASRMEENKKRNMIDLQELLRITKFTKQEIKMMYRGFKQVREWCLFWRSLLYNIFNALKLNCEILNNFYIEPIYFYIESY